MKHSVIFKNAENHWDNALPLGNGVFGTMLYYEDGTLHMPLNHYEVYYNINDSVLPSATAEEDEAFLAKVKDLSDEEIAAYGEEHRARRRKADGNLPPEGEPFCEYRLTREQARDPKAYGITPFSGSYPMTGDLSFSFASALADGGHSLLLDVEDASVTLSLQKEEKSLSMRTVILREDCALNEIEMSEAGLLSAITLSLAPYRDLDAPDITFRAVDAHTVAYTVTRPLPPSGKPFVFSGILRVLGATVTLASDAYTATLTPDGGKSITLMTGIFTDWRYADTEKEGIVQMDAWTRTLPCLKAAHADYFRAFFEKASLSLPDKFLENVYYVNLYALDCCSGKDGVMKHHACGLNGLWDIKHPSLWGSMWYWDVNIQASFAGVFTNNRLSLAKVFSDGLLSYFTRAKRFAVETHGLRGAAIDYPYSFYYSVWPWCAQYLWFLYEYSQDKDYLETDAYPVFLALSEFCLGLFTWDDTLGYFRVYPDISPEQGPLAHDTTATVSSVKYLLKFTLEAAEILGDKSPLLPKIRHLYENLPPYAVAKDGAWGTPIKDSPDAPDLLWLRHPMTLMPIYPTGELDPLISSPEEVKIASDTVDYTFDRAELGIFQGSWIAAASARLGKGGDAIRALYERGLDHMLRSNGLTAEETDHFMNYCLCGRQPLYYPCMMEFTGEMLAAVGEMLLGSHNGVIRVFQAIPDGVPNYKDFYRYGYPIQEEKARLTHYDAWRDVSFDKLLAKGAFEVSATLSDGKLSYIKLHSKAGGNARVTSPFLTEDYRVYQNGAPMDAKWENGILEIPTEKGGEYLIALTPIVTPVKETESAPAVLVHESAQRRKIFIGEDEDTAYYRALDGVTREWYYGNQCHANHTLYKFDFGAKEGKDYPSELTKQVYTDAGRAMSYMRFVPLAGDALPFTPKQGYGFADATGIFSVDRGAPDLLRRDFVEGERDAEFIIEAPRGQYELLVVSGDAEEASLTRIETEEGHVYGGTLTPAGRYQCELVSILQKKDAPLRIRISTDEGRKWKLNLIVLNVIKGY